MRRANICGDVSVGVIHCDWIKHRQMQTTIHVALKTNRIFFYLRDLMF